jgi:hypothetical protein
MNRFFPLKKNLNSTESNDTGSTHHKRLYSRNKSSSHVVPHPVENLTKKKSNTRVVRVRLVFIRIGKGNLPFFTINYLKILGEIDTLNEKFQADVYYEAKWTDKIDVEILKLDDGQKLHLLNKNLTLKIEKLDLTVTWTPELFIENAVGQYGEQDKWYTLKKSPVEHLEPLSPPMININFCEHRRIKGVFWEKLELNHVFSFDIKFN